jgi:hypothetical protein
MEKKILIAFILLVCMILSGFWLSRSGKPLNTLILTVHKLISLGTLIFLALTVVQVHQASALTPLQWAVSLLTGLLFLTLFATGGLLSAGKNMQELVHKIHKFLPYALAISTAINLYLIPGMRN